MKLTLIRIIFVVIGILFSSAVTFGQIANRNGEVWKPIEVQGDRVTAPTNAFIDLSVVGRRFTGNTGCNLMSGTVTIGRGNRVDIRATAVTRRACKMMEGSVVEDSFLDALNRSVRYRRHGQTLDMLDRRGRRMVRFTLVPKDGGPSAGSDLTDPKWELESMGGRMTLVAIKGVFINFDPQKHGVGGDTGCNVFGGSYTAGERNISITDVISTMRACEEGGKMELEREFLEGLRKADRYEIKDDHLHLFSMNKALLTFRAESKQ
jgi:heat shock protein HslJ